MLLSIGPGWRLASARPRADSPGPAPRSPAPSRLAGGDMAKSTVSASVPNQAVSVIDSVTSTRFAADLEERLQRFGWTGARLAREAGLSPTTVQKYRRGEWAPRDKH